MANLKRRYFGRERKTVTRTTTNQTIRRIIKRLDAGETPMTSPSLAAMIERIHGPLPSGIYRRMP